MAVKEHDAYNPHSKDKQKNGAANEIRKKDRVY
jgi:hypothetical protein